VGRLAISPRTRDESFTATDRRLIEDLARQAGVAAHAVRLTEDLQRSRERLVSAREEERRRLRRDLHDGVGPRLAALTLKIETARNRLDHDPASQDLLSDLAERAREAVADVRRSVHALRPPVLDDLGLVPALRETAAQYEGNGLSISVEALDDLSPLPAAVEVAAYRIAQEASANVVRHASARSCAVRFDLDEETGVLRLEVEDDGRGVGEDPGSGVGLSSMRERAEELGGTCVVGPSPAGGMRVRAELPFLEVSGKREKLETDA
jgi:signal transduction histidine kinase